MATVSGTFTANGVSSTLAVGEQPEEITLSVTAPYDGTVALERALTPQMSAWEVIAEAKDPKVTFRRVLPSQRNDRFRVRLKDASLSVTNGDFAAEAGWTLASPWSIGSGVATRTASASNPNLTTEITGLVAGASYVVAFDLTRSAGSMTVDLGGGTASAAQNSTGAKSLTLVAGATNATLRFIADSSFAGTVDNVTITPSIAYSVSDGDAIVAEAKDRDGNILATRTQGGLDVNGTLVSDNVASYVFDASGTFTKPAGAKRIRVVAFGGGGGGGGGSEVTTTQGGSGGGGGGGAGCVEAEFAASEVGATETVTVGAGGTGGAGATSAGPGSNGAAGGNSSFGSLITAYGGGLGSGGRAAAASAGGGGGSNRAAGGDASAGTAGAGGSANGGSGGAGSNAPDAGSGTTAPGYRQGGGGGGGSNVGVGGRAGAPFDGCAGGGAGGGLNTSDAAQNGGVSIGSYPTVNVSGGTGAATGTAGGTRSAQAGTLPGSGGGGGGGGSAGNGGAGGAGQTPGGGGGGGGASLTGDGGVGGAGGSGRVIVTVIF